MEHHITFSFSGRYFTLGESKGARQIWFVLHGYGQLANSFIQKFQSVASRGIYVVAPEGLSKFYQEGIHERLRTGNNRVGATWMTKEDRQNDIRNYITFLNTIYHQEVGTDPTPVTLLGFSQGAATVSRWAIDPTLRYDRLVLWGGILPPDLDVSTGTDVLKTKRCVFVKGTQDPFMTEERFKELNTLTERLGIHPEIVEYDGKHEIHEQTLLKIV